MVINYYNTGKGNMNGDTFPRLVQFTLHHVDTPDLVVRGLNGNQIGANIRRISPVGFEASVVRTEETMQIPSRLEHVYTLVVKIGQGECDVLDGQAQGFARFVRMALGMYNTNFSAFRGEDYHLVTQGTSGMPFEDITGLKEFLETHYAGAWGFVSYSQTGLDIRTQVHGDLDLRDFVHVAPVLQIANVEDIRNI